MNLSQARLRQKFLLIAILIIAFTLRLIAIDQIPAGLSHDEAYNGITAIQVLEGEYRIFFEINKGIEPLIIYLEALAFYFFGVGPVQLRLVNIFCGLLTVALVYPFTCRLFNRRIAVLAMAGVALSFWAVFVSRLTLRAVLLPPLLLLTLYLFWRGLNSINNYQLSIIKSKFPLLTHHSSSVTLLFFALSGITAGITMYTYLSSRFAPLIVLAVFGYQLLRRRINKWHWLGLVLHFVIWAAIFMPLGSYFLENQDSFTHRAGQVSTIPQALEGNFKPVLRNTLRTLGMFTFAGDTTDRYNLDGRPVFDWLNGLLFYAGIGLLLWRLSRPPDVAGPAVLLLSTLFFMLLPDFITDDSPHFLRTIGAMPVVYVVWAIGLETVIHKITGYQLAISNYQLPITTRSASRITYHVSRLLHPSIVILVLLFLTTLHTGYDYFGRWASAPEARYIYGADIAEVAQHIKANYDEGLTVISAEFYRDLDPFRFALHFQGQPPFVVWFDGRQSLAFPPQQSNLQPRYVFPTSAPAAGLWTTFLRYSPAESGREYMIYRLPDESLQPHFEQQMKPLGVNINNDLIISGYQILGQAASGGKFQVLVSWQALRTLPPGADYTFAVQLRDPQNRLWLETDGNGYSPADWQPGVQGLQLLTLRLPGDIPPGSFNLSLQVVDRRQGKVLPAADGQTTISLETITVVGKESK